MTPDEIQEISLASRESELSALQWLAGRLDYFNPLLTQDARGLNRTVKPLAELALTCEVASGSAAGDRRLQYMEFARFIWDQVFTFEPFRENLLDRASGGYAFSIYASLRRCGFEHLNYRSRLQSTIDSGYALGIEQLPFVKLNLLHYLKTAGFYWGGPSIEAVYRTSLLASHPDPCSVTTLDAYALTHVLFFLTDFGRVATDYLSDADLTYLHSALPRLTEYHLRRRDWDLSAELLVCLKAVGLTDLPVYRDAWLLILASQNDDGSFTGPDRVLQEEQYSTNESGAETSAPDGEQSLFWRNYHTTLVALLAMLVAVPA
jgi:hypothetical protein